MSTRHQYQMVVDWNGQVGKSLDWGVNVLELYGRTAGLPSRRCAIDFHSKADLGTIEARMGYEGDQLGFKIYTSSADAQGSTQADISIQPRFVTAARFRDTEVMFPIQALHLGNTKGGGWQWSDAQIFINNQVAGGNDSRIGFGVLTTCKVSLAGRTNLGNALSVYNSDMSAMVPIHASAFTVGSSERTKINVRSLSEDVTPRTTVALDPRSDTVSMPNVMALRPVAFRPAVVNDNVENDMLLLNERRERVGLIAEEVAEVLPSAVSYEDDGDAIGIDYAQIVVALLDHVQRLTARIEQLEGAAT